MIVNIASVGGLRAEFGLGVYNLTKAALIHLTRQLAGELGPTRVVGIAPGLVQTDFAAVLVENFGEALAKQLPTKRLGEPEDIANLAAFLASDAASWITGETYVIDGGAGVRGGVVGLARPPFWAAFGPFRDLGGQGSDGNDFSRPECAPRQRATMAVTPPVHDDRMSTVVVNFPGTRAGSGGRAAVRDARSRLVVRSGEFDTGDRGLRTLRDARRLPRPGAAVRRAARGVGWPHT